MKKYLHILYSWLLLLTLSGCIHESPDDCGVPGNRVNFRFVYDYNKYYADRFAEEVNHIYLFIYNSSGELQELIETDRTAMEDGHTITATLPPGAYTAVAWGNCHTEEYTLTGTEQLTTLQMKLNCIDDQNRVTIKAIGSVFHVINTFEIAGEKETVVPMSMIKNTNRVRIIVKGLSEEEKETAESNMVARIMACNWLYHFDNSVATEENVTYLPEYNSEEDIVTDFYILRMQAEDQENILITLQYRYFNPVSNETGNVVYQLPLIPFLIAETPGSGRSGDEYGESLKEANEYLDRNDEYEIIFQIQSDGNGHILIDEWDKIHKPGELGE